MTFSIEAFQADIAHHQMRVIRDDGWHRHLHFQKPGTMDMHFDVLTWPGYLCYTGDMGTFVFQRQADMLEFFRNSRWSGVHRVPLSYWAEKVQAADRFDGLTEFDLEAFQQEIRKQRRALLKEHGRNWDRDLRREFWGSLEDLISDAEFYDGMIQAFDAAHDWSFDEGGERIHLDTDEFPDCKRFTQRFLWCCHALDWAVAIYDQAKQPAPAVV